MPLWDIVLNMPTLDLAMPTALLVVVLVALFLNKRSEGKLMATVEQKEFKTRDVVLLIVFLAIIISVIAYTTMINPGEVFSNVLMVFFLSSYTMLLFTFSYVFSGIAETRVLSISVSFGTISAVIGVLCFFPQLLDTLTFFRAIAFFSLATFCFCASFYEVRKKAIPKGRWYLASQPPALFVLLFVFFNVIYAGSAFVWFPFLLDVFAFTFAILIIMYLSSMFSWKTVGIFAALLTVMDVILVFSGPMVAAAQTFTGLGLPVLVYLPNLPILLTESGAIAFRGLGLGDFFFAGILAVQTYKKFGKKTGIISTVAMALAFGIWEAFLPEITAFFNIGGFPATVCIISGWLPIVGYYMLTHRKSAQPPSEQITIQPDNSALIE
jgi:hypothetical protein